MQEAVNVAMPRKLRELLAMIYVWGIPANALQLWNTDIDGCIEDFRQHYSAEQSM